MYGCQPSGRGRGQAPGAVPTIPDAQHNHLHLLRGRRGRRLQQFDDRVHPCARLVGAHDAPRHRNRTTTADHAYDYGGGLLPFQRRVYRQRQPVETPPRNATTKGPIAAAARSRGLRPVPSGRGVPAAAVQPLPEVLPHIVPVAPGREGGGGIPAGAPGRNSPAHP